jgi:hypothetical protein
LVTIPKKPCPCVVMAIDYSLTVTPTTPIDVIGAPVAVPTTSEEHPLKIVRASLRGHSQWTWWFGTSSQRTLVLTVHNPNRLPYAFPPLAVVVGQSWNTAARQSLVSIGPYRTRTYDVPVSFPALSFGEQQLNGALGSPGDTTKFAVAIWVFPWGLFLLLLIVVLVIALWVSRAIRRRRRDRGATAGLRTLTPLPVHEAAEQAVGSV